MKSDTALSVWFIYAALCGLLAVAVPFFMVAKESRKFKRAVRREAGMIWEDKQCVTYDAEPMTKDKAANAFLCVIALGIISFAMCLWGVN